MSESRASNVAFSQAATLFQEGMLRALRATDVKINAAFLQETRASYPVDRRLFFASRRVLLDGRTPAVVLPLLNWGPLKPLVAMTSLILLLLGWGWRTRHAQARAILVYNLASPPAIASVIAGRLMRAHVIAVIADVPVPGSGLVRGTILRRLEFWLQARSAPLLDGVVVLTSRIADDFAPNVRALVMEGAVDEYATLDMSTAIPMHTSPENTTIFMYAGGLNEMKGVDVLVEAFSRITEPDARLWITGMGPLERLARDAAAKDQRITFWGFEPYSTLVRRYAAADVLVNPHSTQLLSARYVFPSKLLEYLATGKPVISTVSAPEVLSEYGPYLYLARSDSPDDIARAMGKVLELPKAERDTLGAAARDFVLERKTWRVQAGRIANFISEIAGLPREPGGASARRVTGNRLA